MLELNCTLSQPKMTKHYHITIITRRTIDVVVGGEDREDIEDSIEEAFQDGDFNEVDALSSKEAYYLEEV